jgi:hypothetical protein
MEEFWCAEVSGVGTEKQHEGRLQCYSCVEMNYKFSISMNWSLLCAAKERSGSNVNLFLDE